MIKVDKDLPPERLIHNIAQRIRDGGWLNGGELRMSQRKKVNPYGVISTAVKWFWRVIAIAIPLACIAFFMYATVVIFGWIGALILPGIVVGYALLVILVNFITDGCEAIGRWWRGKQRNWDKTNRA